MSTQLLSKLGEERRGRKEGAEEGMKRGSKVGDIFPSGAEEQSFSSVPVAYPGIQNEEGKNEEGHELEKVRPQFHWNLVSLLHFLPSLSISSNSPRPHVLPER